MALAAPSKDTGARRCMAPQQLEGRDLVSRGHDLRDKSGDPDWCPSGRYERTRQRPVSETSGRPLRFQMEHHTAATEQGVSDP
jgi:hypothetical protein